MSEHFASADLMLPSLRTFHTPREAAHICRELAYDADKREKYVKQNRQHILQRYSEEQMVDQILQSIDNIQNSKFGKTIRLNQVWSSRYRSKGVRQRSTSGNLFKKLINEYVFLAHLDYPWKRHFRLMFWILPNVIVARFADLARKIKNSTNRLPLVGPALQEFTSSRRNSLEDLTG